MLTQSLSASHLLNGNLSSIDGKNIELQSLKGKTVMVVNIATRCGYTKQLKGLEELYQKYKPQGFVVIGIPSNEFGAQTPEQEPEVKKFCELNYGVSFLLTTKTSVKGANKHPWVAQLIQASREKSEITWNFEKFLINSKGELVERFLSKVEPTDNLITQAIEKSLSQK